MTCDEVRDLLPEHLLGTLEGPEDLEVRLHLRGCVAYRSLTVISPTGQVLATAAIDHA